MTHLEWPEEWQGNVVGNAVSGLVVSQLWEEMVNWTPPPAPPPQNILSEDHNIATQTAFHHHTAATQTPGPSTTTTATQPDVPSTSTTATQPDLQATQTQSTQTSTILSQGHVDNQTQTVSQVIVKLPHLPALAQRACTELKAWTPHRTTANNGCSGVSHGFHTNNDGHCGRGPN